MKKRLVGLWEGSGGGNQRRWMKKAVVDIKSGPPPNFGEQALVFISLIPNHIFCLGFSFHITTHVDHFRVIICELTVHQMPNN